MEACSLIGARLWQSLAPRKPWSRCHHHQPGQGERSKPQDALIRKWGL